MLEILWESATKFRKETVYVCSDIFLLVKKKPCFPCLLDYFSTSLFDKKSNKQREISDTVSSVCSEQLEGGTGEVSSAVDPLIFLHEKLQRLSSISSV